MFLQKCLVYCCVLLMCVLDMEECTSGLYTYSLRCFYFESLQLCRFVIFGAGHCLPHFMKCIFSSKIVSFILGQRWKECCSLKKRWIRFVFIYGIGGSLGMVKSVSTLAPSSKKPTHLCSLNSW